MNRIAKCLCMVAVIALAFTACKKKETDTKVLNVNYTTEQLEVVDDELGGRIYLDDQLRVQFENGDKVMMFNCPTNGNPSAYCVYTLYSNGATWIGDDSNVGNTGVYYAYYPGGTEYVTPNLSNENRATFTLKDTQEFRSLDGKTLIPRNALYMASKSNGTTLATAYFTFKNICGVLAMNLYSVDAKKVTRIELTDPSFNLVGDVTLKIDEVDPDEMTNLLAQYDIHSPIYVSRLTNYINRVGYQISGNVSKTVTLECPTPVELGTTEAEATTFYFVLRPLAMRDGCSIKVYFDDNTDATLETQVSHLMRPNHIMKMKPIQVD